MRQRELQLFRRLLEDRKRVLLSEAERALDSMNEKPVEGFSDPTDRASHESDRNLLLRIRDRERKFLSKINEAFIRLNGGSYGQCDECGEEIGLERLRARPVTTLCIDCKSAQEARERLNPPR
jgi:DnaK suppressor protein